MYNIYYGGGGGWIMQTNNGATWIQTPRAAMQRHPLTSQDFMLTSSWSPRGNWSLTKLKV